MGPCGQELDLIQLASRFMLSYSHMTNSLSPQRAGMALGGLLATIHLVWAVLVAVGLAKPLIEFIMRVHMVSEPVTVLPFDLVTAIELVVVTGLVGFAVGHGFAHIWNTVGKKS